MEINILLQWIKKVISQKIEVELPPFPQHLGQGIYKLIDSDSYYIVCLFVLLFIRYSGLFLTRISQK